MPARPLTAPPQDAIREFFAECGPLAEVRVAYDRDTGRARGFAHIQFEEVEGAAKAILLSGSNMMDREVYIESTTEREQRECLYGFGGFGAGAARVGLAARGGGGFRRWVAGSGCVRLAGLGWGWGWTLLLEL